MQVFLSEEMKGKFSGDCGESGDSDSICSGSSGSSSSNSSSSSSSSGGGDDDDGGDGGGDRQHYCSWLLIEVASRCKTQKHIDNMFVRFHKGSTFPFDLHNSQPQSRCSPVSIVLPNAYPTVSTNLTVPNEHDGTSITVPSSSQGTSSTYDALISTLRHSPSIRFPPVRSVSGFVALAATSRGGSGIIALSSPLTEEGSGGGNTFQIRNPRPCYPMTVITRK